MAKLKNTSIKKINTDAPILEVKDENEKNILKVDKFVEIVSNLNQTGDAKIGANDTRIEVTEDKITMTGETEVNGKLTQTGEVNIGPDGKKLSIDSKGTNITGKTVISGEFEQTGNASIGPNADLKLTVGKNNKISLNGDTNITGKLVQTGGIEIKEGETSIIDTTETSKIKIIGELNQTGNVKLGGETCKLEISEVEGTGDIILNGSNNHSIKITGDMISLNNNENNSGGIYLKDDGEIEINSDLLKSETTNAVVKISGTKFSLENKTLLNNLLEPTDPTDYYINSNKLLLEEGHIKLGRVDDVSNSTINLKNSLAYLDIENSYSGVSENETIQGISMVNIFAGDDNSKSEINLGVKTGTDNGISIKNTNAGNTSGLTIGNEKVSITGELTGSSADFTEYNLRFGDLSNIKLKSSDTHVVLSKYIYNDPYPKYRLASVNRTTGDLTLGNSGKNPTITITNEKTGTDPVNPNITIAANNDNSTINLTTGETDRQKCEIIMDSSETNDPSIKFKIGKRSSATRLYETFEIHEDTNGTQLKLNDSIINAETSSLKIISNVDETNRDSYAVVIGSKTSDSTGGIAIGFKTKSEYYHGIAIGNNANAKRSKDSLAGSYNGSIAIGYNAESDNRGVAIGRDAKTGSGTNINAGDQSSSSDKEYLYLGVGGQAWAKATSNESGFSKISDYRDKTDFKPIESALSFINSLEPLTFRVNPRYKYYKDGKFQEDDYKLGKQAGHRRLAGFKAQDVYQKMIDEYHDDNYAQIVDYSKYDNPEDTNDVYSIYTASLVPFLTRAIQEQEEIINKLEERILALEKQLEINKEKE